MIKRLHPNVASIVWSSTFLLRGLEGEEGYSKQVHLDIYPETERRNRFLEAHPEGFNDFREVVEKAPADAEGGDLELGMVLGLWKPRVAIVRDHPLVVLDASSCNVTEEAAPQEMDFYANASAGDGSRVRLANLNANLKSGRATKHRW